MKRLTKTILGSAVAGIMALLVVGTVVGSIAFRTFVTDYWAS